MPVTESGKKMHIRESTCQGRLKGVIAAGLMAVAAAGSGGYASAEEDTTFPLRLEDRVATFTTREARGAFLKELEAKPFPGLTKGRPNYSTETQKQLRDWLWARGLIHAHDGLPAPVRQKTIGASGNVRRIYDKCDEPTQRQLLETVYGIAPQPYAADMLYILSTTTSTKHFAMAANYLTRLGPNRGSSWSRIKRQMTRRFPDWKDDPILVALNHDAVEALMGSKPPRIGLAADEASSGAPQLRSLLEPSFAKGFPVIYSLLRRDRSQPGLAVVRRADGRFVRHGDGSVWSTSHLTRSNSNLPGYLTNGNTPQGLFTVRGLGVSRANKFIGKTPYIHTFLPWEAAPGEYFHDESQGATTWTLDMYKDFLPAEWREFAPFHTAYLAGHAGRSKILAHGTCIDPAYFAGAPWYPNTTAIGCLTAPESWHPETGQALSSGQLALVAAFLAAAENREVAVLPSPGDPVPPQPMGFLAVVELNDDNRPVTLDEVLEDILLAELGQGSD